MALDANCFIEENWYGLMSDTPMDVAYNPIVTDPEPANPSSHINPSVGMKKPQYGYSFGRTVGGGIHDKRVVDIWTLKADTPMPENPIMPTNTYQGCDCETCKELNVNCDNCPVCNNGAIDSEIEMAMYDSSVGKSIFFSAKDYTKQTRVDRLFR